MLKLSLGSPNQPLRLLCIGAHSDDIEIGCGGTILEWLSTYRHVEVTWVVFCAPGLRADEARDSANALLRKAKKTNLVLRDFRDGYLPAQFAEAKYLFEELKSSEKPDLIVAHYLEDRHQDHRLIAELTWQTFRDHLILEYEIPKYEGDLGQPNLFVPLSYDIGRHKVDHLIQYFGSQRSKVWFRPETFFSLMQLRGMECRAESGLAEALHARKLCL
jgi:LmbE family N-acetylglucosaminyl deacetylase